MKANIDIESKLDILLQAAEHPEQFTDEELKSLCRDAELANYTDLMEGIRLAILKRHVRRPDVNKEWKRFEAVYIKNKVKKVGMQTKIYVTVTTLAACLLLGFFIFKGKDRPEKHVLAQQDATQVQLIPYGDKQILVKVPKGCTYKMMLPDGTTVMMNADSRLIYPTDIEVGRRIVSLDGEAYFEVVSNKSRPFIVESAQSQVCVLGTHFNVRAYKDEPYCVSLLEGSVCVKSKIALDSVVIHPGEDARLSADGAWVVSNFDRDAEMWQNGYFYYDNTSLKDILQDIGRFYNVEIVTSEQDSLQVALHFKASKKLSLKEIIEQLNSLQSFTLKLNEKNQIVITN